MKQLASLVFENTTPLWAGGPLGGATYYKLGSRIIGPWLPDAKPVVGRTRWLLRAAEASALARLGRRPKSLSEVDKTASRLFGDTSSASKILVRVTATIDEQGSSTGSRYYLDPGTHNAIRQAAQGIRLPMGLEVDAFLALRGRLGLPSQPLLKGRDKARYQDYRQKLSNITVPQSLLLLAGIPRFRLLIQARDGVEKLFTHQPLPPGSVRLHVELYRRSGSNLSPDEAELAAVSITYTLVFLGVGRATSRGFGRLVLADDGIENLSEELSGAKQLLRMMTRGSLASGQHALKAFKDIGNWIVERVCGLLGTRCPQPPQRALLRIPSLDVATANADLAEPLVHPCPYALPELTAPSKPGCCSDKRPVGEIHDALSALGRATMKVVWKVCGGVSPTSPGPAFHTWILGLPRHGKAGRISTGYLATNDPRWAWREYCGHSMPRNTRFEEVRRASPFVLTPYCSNGSCYALVEPFTTLDDFADLVAGGKPIVHIGVHRPNRVVHIAGVYNIATRPRLGIRISNQRRCPADPAGVARPGNRSPLPRGSSALDVVREVSEAALEWIKVLLR